MFDEGTCSADSYSIDRRDIVGTVELYNVYTFNLLCLEDVVVP